MNGDDVDVFGENGLGFSRDGVFATVGNVDGGLVSSGLVVVLLSSAR